MGEGGSSDADVRTFWCKHNGFFEFMVCSHGQGEGVLSRCGHFANKEEGSIFRDFVRTSFMNGP